MARAGVRTSAGPPEAGSEGPTCMRDPGGSRARCESGGPRRVPRARESRAVGCGVLWLPAPGRAAWVARSSTRGLSARGMFPGDRWSPLGPSTPLSAGYIEDGFAICFHGASGNFAWQVPKSNAISMHCQRAGRSGSYGQAARY